MAMPQVLQRARLQLMLGQPYLAAAIARYPHIPLAGDNGWCDIAATDGHSIFLNIEACSGLPEPELQFVLAHEALHCLLGHPDRRGSRERTLWNIAVDYATNLILVSAGLEAPSGALFAYRWRGMTAEEIYGELEPSARDGSLELHTPAGPVPWSSLAERERRFRAVPGGDQHLDQGDIEGTAWRADLPSAIERRRLRRMLSRELRSELPGREAGIWAKEIQAAESRHLPWEQLLARFFGRLQRTDYRSFPFNHKHLWRDLFLPSLGKPGPDHIVVAVDTSGSIDEMTLGRMLAEIDHLRATTASRMTLIECDAEIHATTHYEAHEPASFERHRFYGRGGTDLRPVFTWLEERIRQGETVDALIYMTDGYGAVPDEAPAWPVLWVVPESGVESFAYGQRLVLQDHQSR